MANSSETSAETDHYDWMRYGFTLDKLFEIARKFFKDNEGKVFHPPYDLRNQILALAIQAKHGPFDPSKASPLGALDLVGRDRRIAWVSLGQLNSDDAKIRFVQLIEASCPAFKPFIEAHQKEMEERIKHKGDNSFNSQTESQGSNSFSQSNPTTKEQFFLSKDQRRAIKEWLNFQTYSEFKKSACHIYPNDEVQQSIHIRKLQEQHFEQFIQQFQPSNHQPIVEVNGNSDNNHQMESTPQCPLLKSQGQPISYNSTVSPNPLPNSNSTSNIDVKSLRDSLNELSKKERLNSGTLDDENDQEDDDDSDDDQIDYSAIEIPQMWTNKDIKTFRDSIKLANEDGIIKVGHGEIVTVRVPTYPDGTRIFWEFATDNYDIGFGLFFEWTKNPGNQVSISISESEEEEDDEEDEIVTSQTNGPDDCEKGRHKGNTSSDEFHTSIIVPIHRRECHEEVYAGSHSYPGKGAYLLKFDNTYSLWRSKTLYYRIYYDKN